MSEDVSERTEQTVTESRRQFNQWLWRIPVIAALGGAIWGAQKAARVHYGKIKPNPEPEFETKEAQEVVPLSQLVRVWDSAEFVMGGIPSLALRLPTPIPGGLTVDDDAHFAAFSRLCTHQSCPVSFNEDIETIAIAYNYRPPTPALVCNCHLSVFLPAEAGLAASGPAREPLPRVRLELRDDVLFAVGLEV